MNTNVANEAHEPALKPAMDAERSSQMSASYRLYKGLQKIVSYSEILDHSCNGLIELLTSLDKAQRHDVVFNDQELIAYGCPINGMGCLAVTLAIRELERTLGILNSVEAKISGQFKGELKVKVENRLLKHHAEAHNIITLLSKTRKELQPARTPYLIRQRQLSGLHNEISDLILIVADLRRSFARNEIPQHLFLRLFDAESDLYKMRTAVGKWRDNPSQKMGAKIKGMAKKMEQLSSIFVSLKADSLAYNAALGCEVFTRQGKVEMNEEISRYQCLN